MHRASAACPALLMATATAALLVARVHSLSALETVNPWLSACDLVHPAANDDLQGACSTIMSGQGSGLVGPGPPTTACPLPCAATANNHTTKLNQCLLYLEESHKDAVCDGGNGNRDNRLQQIHELRLRHCCEHAVITALKPSDRQAVLAGGAQCKHHLDALLEIDALAARISCEFTEVLTRYDCGQPYSIVYHCDDCKEAYRRWVCSSLVPHLPEGRRIRPCRNVCQTVEQRCPYMLPGDRAPAHPTQYAGEPTFLCLDPNIPETGKQRFRSSHGDSDCCYTYCGTPGRPCANCPAADKRSTSLAKNMTWDVVHCPQPPPGSQRTGSECRSPVASSSGAAASNIISHHKTLLLTLKCTNNNWTWIILLLLHVVVNCYCFTADSNHIIYCLLLMCCVQCARTTVKIVLIIKTKWKKSRYYITTATSSSIITSS